MTHPLSSSSSTSPATAHAYPPRKPRWTLSTLLNPRSLLRPSVRLKTSLLLLSLCILTLVLLALNAAHLAHAPPAQASGGEIATSPSDDSPANSGAGVDVAKGKDAHLVEQDIQRSFEEPDYALLSGTQPSRIGCDVPLSGEGAPGEEGVMVFLGIFSGYDKKDRRDL